MKEYYKYWGKAEKNEDDSLDYHLLVYHCLDVAAVGKVWLKKTPGFVKRVSAASGLSEVAFQEWFLFFLALHDVGKFDIRFQGKVPEVLNKLQPDTIGKFPPNICRGFEHGSSGYLWGCKEQGEYFPDTSDSFLAWLQKVTGHHGRIPQNDTIRQPAFTNKTIVVQDKNARVYFTQLLKELFVPDMSFETLPDIASPILAGFCSVCDWIGSNRDYFPFVVNRIAESPLDDMKRYLSLRLSCVEKALETVGVIGTRRGYGGMKYLFPKYKPRGVQTVVDTLPIKQSLTIIEAPTGSGKTEAAFAFASHLITKKVVDTITFALPTQATANAMLERIEKIAPKVFTGDTSIVLAHGKSLYNEEFARLKKGCSALSSLDDCRIQCSNWIGSSKKRSFLGQIGLCTIDQVLLSVLPVKHYFVRSFGLGRSVLIVDEVHAYDSYMYGLLAEVIAEQKSMGGSVILLSATLPNHQKEKLIEAWGAVVVEEDKNYPLITSVTEEGKPLPIALNVTEHPTPFSVGVELIACEEMIYTDGIIDSIVYAAEKGAVVGVICNLVADAQELADSISLKVSDKITVDIFHSRYRFSDRQEKELAVISEYGEKTKRRGRILVATQVVEQSLDIDFDWILTQLCPIDLLFQRLGRLHRHTHNRPVGFEEPRVTVLVPKNEFEYGDSKFVYSNILALWRTQKLLENNSEIYFPDAYRIWIENVYNENFVDDEGEYLQNLHNDYIGKEFARSSHAKMLARGRDTINPFDDLSEEAGSLTRDGEMSLGLIPFSSSPCDMTLLDGTVVSELEEWQKWETFSMNAVPVPAFWKNDLEYFEEGYMKIILVEEGTGIWKTNTDYYSYCYTKERGLERTKT